MSKTTKTVLIVLGVLLLCCCVVGVGGYIFLSQGLVPLVEGMIVDDPAEIMTVADEIADYQLPSGYEEEFVMNILGIKTLFITNPSQGGMIMMMQFNESLFGSSVEMQGQFQESFMQQYDSNGIDFVYTGERTVEINGQDVDVLVYEGSDSQGYDHVQWVTTINTENGTVMVMIMGVAYTWDDAEMENFLKSIQ